MAGAPPGFNDLLQRKYANQESATDSENALRAAQAQVATGSLASENALRNAQAFQTTEAGKTLAPTSAANIASTYADIPGMQARTNLENAQAGYYGAEAAATRFNTTDPASDAEFTNYWASKNTLGNYGLGSGVTQGLSTPTTTQNQRSITDPYAIPQKPSPGANAFQLFSGGTDDVQPLEYDPMNAYSGGTAKVQPPAQAPSAVAPPQATMGAAPPIGGAIDFHTVMAHAMHALATSHPSASNPMHAAGGMTTVPPPAPPAPAPPGPGQTQTSGDWGGQNQGLRAQMGYGKPVVKGYDKGTAKVPGKGPGNVDSVPSVLAPGEAVLNKGAADHMGRGAIAALNALGAAKMAASGAPPAPPQGGPPMMAAGPARGAPKPPMMPSKGTTPGGAPKPSAPPMSSSKGKPNPKSAPNKPAPKAAAAGKR